MPQWRILDPFPSRGYSAAPVGKAVIGRSHCCQNLERFVRRKYSDVRHYASAVLKRVNSLVLKSSRNRAGTAALSNGKKCELHINFKFSNSHIKKKSKKEQVESIWMIYFICIPTKNVIISTCKNWDFHILFLVTGLQKSSLNFTLLSVRVSHVPGPQKSRVAGE